MKLFSLKHYVLLSTIVLAMSIYPSCSTVTGNELDCKISDVLWGPGGVAVFIVDANRTAITPDNIYFNVGLSYRGKVYTDTNGKKTHLAIQDFPTSFGIIITDVGIIIDKINNARADKIRTAETEYQKFLFNHSAELSLGSMGQFVGMDYDRYQALLKERDRLEEARHDSEVDLTAICKGTVDIVIIKEPFTPTNVPAKQK